jgi:uncharacterized protein (DUF433 family)
MQEPKQNSGNSMVLVKEDFGGETYEYYSLGEYIVSAPGVCGGRPTFKHTRIEASGALNLLAAGYAIEKIADQYEVPPHAIEEAIRLAGIRLDGWLATA